MGLFDFLSSKSYTDHETLGDRYTKSEEFGPAKLEYEKALSMLNHKSVPNPLHHKERMEKKINESCESLASQHKKSAENLIEAGCNHDAEELLNLAMELTENPELTDQISEMISDLRKQDNRRLYDIEPEYEPGRVEDVETPEDEYFLLLCSPMPEEIQRIYQGYGQSFETGFVLLNQGDFEGAAELLTRSLEENDPEVNYIHLELATAYLNLEEIDRALQLLENFIQYYPGVIRAYGLLCDIYWEMGSFEQAADLLMGSPDELKTELSINLLMGETLFRSEKYHEAKTFYQEYLKHNGLNEHIAKALGKTHEALKETEKAREVYGAIINSCNSCGAKIDPHVKYRYAELSYETDEIPGSILDLYFSLCQEDPVNRKTYFKRISDIYHQRGHLEEARRYAGFSEMSDPENT